MTFLPRITTTLASASEPSEHGAGRLHGASHDSHDAGEGAPGQAGEASSDHSHGPFVSQPFGHSTSADASELTSEPVGKTNGKRDSRPRAERGPSFAAELQKKVVSDAQEPQHADLSAGEGPFDAAPEQGLLDDSETAELPPSRTHGEPGPRAAGSEQRLVPRADGAGEALGAAIARGIAPADSAPLGVPASGLPRAVVNGSGEAPNSDAMSVSPRLSTGSHVHADVEAAPRSFSTDVASDRPTLMTAAAEHAVFVEGAVSAEPRVSLVDGSPPGVSHASDETPVAVPVEAQPVHVTSPRQPPARASVEQQTSFVRGSLDQPAHPRTSEHPAPSAPTVPAMDSHAALASPQPSQAGPSRTLPIAGASSPTPVLHTAPSPASSTGEPSSPRQSSLV